MSIREQYQKQGVVSFYKNHGKEYRNPHEAQIKKIIEFANKNWNINFSDVLDLAAGSGEATIALKDIGFSKIDATDPFTFEAYEKRTGKKCSKFSFEDIMNGKIKKKYSVVICSFAMHLVEPSKLPLLSFALSRITKNILLITPHKRPVLRWGWKIENETTIDKVRGRLYKYMESD